MMCHGLGVVITCGRGLANTGGRAVASPRALGGYNLLEWGVDDLRTGGVDDDP